MKLSLIPIASLLAGFVALTAQAIPITGQINIQTGLVTTTPNVLGAVTGVNGSNNGIVTSVEGAYPASLLGEVVTYKAFTVSAGAQAISNFWSVTDVLAPLGGGYTYSFDLISISGILQSNTSLTVNGLGTLRSTDPLLTPTAALWSYGINSADGSPTSGFFSFQSNNVSRAVGVPDGGATVMMFGVGLVGLAGLSRAFKPKNRSAQA